MESVTDYLVLNYNSIADYLVLGSVIIFLVGILSVFVTTIQINKKSRYFFITALILFGAAIAMGWNDVNVALKQIWNTW